MDSKIKYSSQLDALRAIAVILTLLCHWVNDIWHYHIRIFEYGVDIFFAISGFLITSILLKEKKELLRGGGHAFKHLKNFYLRRFLRLMPVYYLYLTGILILGRLIGFTPWPEGVGVYFFTYLPNIFIFFNGLHFQLVNHFWSLGVEEQFYLLWPFLVLFLPIKSLKYILILLIISGVILHTIPFHLDVRYLPFGNFHTLGFGALLAFYNELEKKKIQFIEKYKTALIVISLFVLTLTVNTGAGLLWGLHQSSLFFVTGILTIGSYLQWKGLANLYFNSTFFQRIGKISYGIYVVHKPMHYLLGPQLIKIRYFNNGIILIIIYFVATYMLASFSYKYIETPFLRLKKKFS